MEEKIINNLEKKKRLYLITPMLIVFLLYVLVFLLSSKSILIIFRVSLSNAVAIIFAVLLSELAAYIIGRSLYKNLISDDFNILKIMFSVVFIIVSLIIFLFIIIPEIQNESRFVFVETYDELIEKMKDENCKGVKVKLTLIKTDDNFYNSVEYTDIYGNMKYKKDNQYIYYYTLDGKVIGGVSLDEGYDGVVVLRNIEFTENEAINYSLRLFDIKLESDQLKRMVIYK